jgi:hypothetical protein
MCQGTIMRITHPENSGYVLHLKISDDVDDFPISEQSVELSQMCPHGHTADIPCIECEPAYPTRNEAQPEPSAPDATAERLQQIAEREALATKGPWAGDSVTVNNWPSDVDQPEVLMEWLCNGDGVVHTGDEPYANAEHDGQFIAHARSDIPYLLKLVEELRQKINENRGKLICSFCGTIHSYDPEQEHGMVDAVLAHIEICEKSPLVQLLDANRENLNLKARAEKAEAERDSLYKRVEELTRQPITAEENAKLVTPPAKP